MSEKKVVSFAGFIGWEEHPSGAIQARLRGVTGHYRLGDCPWVLTSAVKRIEYAEPAIGERSPVEIETLNTIYKKVGHD